MAVISEPAETQPQITQPWPVLVPDHQHGCSCSDTQDNTKHSFSWAINASPTGGTLAKKVVTLCFFFFFYGNAKFSTGVTMETKIGSVAMETDSSMRQAERAVWPPQWWGDDQCLTQKIYNHS